MHHALSFDRTGFGLQFFTALLMAFAVAFVLLQLSVRIGIPVDGVDALAF